MVAGSGGHRIWRLGPSLVSMSLTINSPLDVYAFVFFHVVGIGISTPYVYRYATANRVLVGT